MAEIAGVDIAGGVDDERKSQGRTLQEWTLTGESARVDKDGVSRCRILRVGRRVAFYGQTD